MSEAPLPEPVNPWRSETTVPLAAGPVVLHCTMDRLARLFPATGADSLVGLYRSWDALTPSSMQACFRLLAPDPAMADEAWPRMAGIRDLAELRSGFYRVTSGMTPEEIAEAEEREKKSGGALALMSAEAPPRNRA